MSFACHAGSWMQSLRAHVERGRRRRRRWSHRRDGGRLPPAGPGVVMLHEGWGIDDVLRRHADRLASAGYLVHARICSARAHGCDASESRSRRSRPAPASRSSWIESCRNSCGLTATAPARLASSAFAWAADSHCCCRPRATTRHQSTTARCRLTSANWRRARAPLLPVTAAGIGRPGRAGAARSPACSRRTARCRGLSSGRPQLLERQAERPTAVSPDDEADPCGTGADLGRRCVEANRGLLRRAPQLVMSLRRKCQTANQSAMIAYPMDQSAPVIMSE